MLARKVPADKALLFSDHSGDINRFEGVSNFWISHPTNIVDNNVAAGSEGTGFWMSFINRSVRGKSVPRTSETLSFNGNVAHSTVVGITWDGAPDGELTNNPRNPEDRRLVSAHYHPRNIQNFKNLVAFKNSRTGIYFRGETVVFENAKLSNNGWSAFFAYNQVVRDSLIVGISESHDENDFKHLHTHFTSHKQPYAGVIVYDGPFHLEGVDFVNFSDKEVKYEGKDYTPRAFFAIGGADRFTNTVEKLRFDPQPRMKVYYEHNLNWVDSSFNMGIRDLDGSLWDEDFDPYDGRRSPFAGKLFVPNWDYNDHESCVDVPLWIAKVCDYNQGMLRIDTNQANYVPFQAKRLDTGVEMIDREVLDQVMNNFINQNGVQFNNKSALILGDDRVEYEYFFPKTPNGRYITEATDYFKLLYRAETNNTSSPLIKLTNIGEKACRVRGLSSSFSQGQLRQRDQGYYFDSSRKTLWVKLKTKARLDHARIPGTENFRADTHEVECRSGFFNF